MLKRILLGVFVIMCLSCTSFAEPWKLIEDEHMIQEGETLDSIAADYIKLNTYGQRELREFKSGIIELNYSVLKDGLVPGTIIQINYWINDN